MEKKPHGRPKKLGDHQVYPLRLPADLHRDLRHFAIDAKRSLNDVLVEVISQWWSVRANEAPAKRAKTHGGTARPRA